MLYFFPSHSNSDSVAIAFMENDLLTSGDKNKPSR